MISNFYFVYFLFFFYEVLFTKVLCQFVRETNIDRTVESDKDWLDGILNDNKKRKSFQPQSTVKSRELDPDYKELLFHLLPRSLNKKSQELVKSELQNGINEISDRNKNKQQDSRIPLEFSSNLKFLEPINNELGKLKVEKFISNNDNNESNLHSRAIPISINPEINETKLQKEKNGNTEKDPASSIIANVSFSKEDRKPEKLSENEIYGKEPPYPHKITPYNGEKPFSDFFNIEDPFFKEEEKLSEKKPSLNDNEILEHSSNRLSTIKIEQKQTETNKSKLPPPKEKLLEIEEVENDSYSDSNESESSSESDSDEFDDDSEIPIEQSSTGFWNWFGIKWVPLGEYLFPGYLNYMYPNQNYVKQRYGLTWRPAYYYICLWCG